MSAEIVIKFEGDAAFLNSLTSQQAVPTVQQARSPHQPGMTHGEAMVDVIRQSAKALGIGPAFESIASKVEQVRTLATSLRTAMGVTSTAGGTIQNMSALRAATNASAQGSVAGSAMAGGMAAAAGGPLTPTIAAAVVAVGTFALAVKKSAELVNSEVVKLKEKSPRVMAEDSILQINRDLRMMRRGEELGPQLAKWMAQQDKFDAAHSEIWTEMLRVMLTIWEASRPVLEFTHDTLATVAQYIAEMNLTLIQLKHNWGAASDEELTAARKVHGDAKARAEEAWMTENLPSKENLGSRAADMAKELLRNFGTGGRGPAIPPSRPRR